jgi:hypothetical protein
MTSFSDQSPSANLPLLDPVILRNWTCINPDENLFWTLHLREVLFEQPCRWCVPTIEAYGDGSGSKLLNFLNQSIELSGGYYQRFFDEDWLASLHGFQGIMSMIVMSRCHDQSIRTPNDLVSVLIRGLKSKTRRDLWGGET